jgi:hypothetical protein
LEEVPLTDHSLQIFFRTRVYPAVLHTGGIGKIDLRFFHMKKAQGVFADLLPRLRYVQDVIGKGGHPADEWFPGSQGPERNDSGHAFFSF